jgi:hypothetical protein
MYRQRDREMRKHASDDIEPAWLSDSVYLLAVKFIAVSLRLFGEWVTCHSLDRAQATDNRELHPASASQSAYGNLPGLLL